MTGLEGGDLLVIALDRPAAGGVAPQVPRRPHRRLDEPNGPASPSPVTDGDHVYAFFQDFGLLAFTAEGQASCGACRSVRSTCSTASARRRWWSTAWCSCRSIRTPVPTCSGRRQDRRSQRYKVDRPGVISGYSTPTVYQPKGAPKQILIPESFQLSAYDVKDGHRVWWVRGLACEMKSVASIDGDTRVGQRLGLLAEPARAPDPDDLVGRGPEGLRQEQGRHASPATRSTGGPEPRLDRMLRADSGFPAFDVEPRRLPRRRRLGRSCAPCSRPRTACSRSSSAGKGDMTEGAVKWKYHRPVPQVPVDAPLQGRAVHGQRQRHPALDRSRRPATC